MSPPHPDGSAERIIDAACGAIERLCQATAPLYAWDAPAGLDAVHDFARTLAELWVDADAAAAHGQPPGDHARAVQHAVRHAKKIVLSAPCGAAARAECIGRGGFGQVFASRLLADKHGGVPAAVKLVKPPARAGGTDALSEIAIALGIQRRDALGGASHVMPVLHVDINPRTAHVRLAFPLGMCDLLRLVRPSGAGAPAPLRVTPRTLRRWCAELAAALAEIHACGVVHGDVKASNVIVFARTEDAAAAESMRAAVRAVQLLRARATTALGAEAAADMFGLLLEFATLRVADFGLSAFAASERAGVVETNPTFPYTAQYRPVEVWYDHRWSYSADVWALGCTVYEMAFGRALFAEEKHAPLATAHARRAAYISAHERFARTYNLFAQSSPRARAPGGADDAAGEDAAPGVRCGFKSSEWKAADPMLASFIASMLQLSPRARLSAVDLLEHPYVADEPACARARDAGCAIPTLRIEALGLPPGGEDALEAACAAAAPGDALVRRLGAWLLAREMPLRRKSRSARVRAMGLAELAATCCQIAAKVLRRPQTNARVAPRDERSVCEQLGFELFPFGAARA